MLIGGSKEKVDQQPREHFPPVSDDEKGWRRRI
jgi:hypothetical protein